MNANVIVDDKKLEKELLESTIEEVFDYLHYKLDQTGKPVMMGVQYSDVLFKISVEPVEKKIVPRGYDHD